MKGLSQAIFLNLFPRLLICESGLLTVKEPTDILSSSDFYPVPICGTRTCRDKRFNVENIFKIQQKEALFGVLNLTPTFNITINGHE